MFLIPREYRRSREKPDEPVAPRVDRKGSERGLVPQGSSKKGMKPTKRANCKGKRPWGLQIKPNLTPSKKQMLSTRSCPQPSKLKNKITSSQPSSSQPIDMWVHSVATVLNAHPKPHAIHPEPSKRILKVSLRKASTRLVLRTRISTPRRAPLVRSSSSRAEPAKRRRRRRCSRVPPVHGSAGARHPP